MYINNYTLIQTSPGCPEQYDVFDEHDSLVGYLRLRHGHFHANTLLHNELVYEAITHGDGTFADNIERTHHLDAAIKALIQHQQQ